MPTNTAEAKRPGVPVDLAAEALHQMVVAAGPGGAAEDDLRAAFDELQDIFVNVAICATTPPSSDIPWHGACT